MTGVTGGGTNGQGVSGRDLNCNEVVEMITDYLEGAMPADDVADFERHLAECPYCVAYLEQMQATIAMLGELDSPDVPNDVVEALVAVYREEHGRTP